MIFRHSLLKNPSFICRQCPKDSSLREFNLLCQIFFPLLNHSLTRRNFTKSKQANKIQLEFLDKVLRRQTATFCPLPAKSQTCSRKSEQQKQQTHLTQKERRNDGIIGANKQDQIGQHAQKQIVAPIVNDKGNTLRNLYFNISFFKGNLRPLPGTSTTHKESVFMKLNKRLSILEQNMSASAEHLMELSRKCSLQTDEVKQDEKITITAKKLAKQESQRIEEEMKQKVFF